MDVDLSVDYESYRCQAPSDVRTIVFGGKAKLSGLWASDITCVPLRHGFLYLVAVMDWYSRYVLSWRLSNTLTGSFCLEELGVRGGRGVAPWWKVQNPRKGTQADKFFVCLCWRLWVTVHGRPVGAHW